MTLTESIVRLAKKYNIDLAKFREHNNWRTSWCYSPIEKPQGFNVFMMDNLSIISFEEIENLAINILVDIKGEYTGHTIIDGFYLYSKDYLQEKDQLREMIYILKEYTDERIQETKRLIINNKKE